MSSKPETSTERYESEMGEPARERQQREARDRFLCCGERKADGHHHACALRPADDRPPEGQQALLL